jgi:hypothetical protein
MGLHIDHPIYSSPLHPRSDQGYGLPCKVEPVIAAAESAEGGGSHLLSEIHLAKVTDAGYWMLDGFGYSDIDILSIEY